MQSLRVFFKSITLARCKEGKRKRIHRSTACINFACVISLILLATPSLGAIRHVPADYPSIQAGIDAAGSGDTVLVAAGSYSENIDFKGKPITVKSTAGPESTIIDGSRAGTVVTFWNNEGNDSVLEGFKLTNGLPAESMELIFPYGGGISVRNASPRIVGNIVTANGATDGGGIHVMGDEASPAIENNIISKNIGAYVGGGIVARDGASPVIRNNTITDNFTMQGSAIYVTNNAHPNIEGNTIENNDGGCCCMGRTETLQYMDGIDIKNKLGCGNFFPSTILVADKSAAVIRNNHITGNLSGGIGVFLDSAPVIDNNQILDNHGPHLAAGGLFVAQSSAPVVTSNTIEGNQGAAIWVDRSSSLLDEDRKPISLEGFQVIEDTSNAIVYSGHWQRAVGAIYSGGTRRATGAGASASLRFKGTGVSLIYFGCCGSGGMADIQIDGVPYPPVDTFSPDKESYGKSEQVLATGLSPIEHVLTVTVSNEKNPLSSGYGFCLDAIGVLPETKIGKNTVVGAVYTLQKPSSPGPQLSTPNKVLRVPDQYTHIQDAIEAAANGDTIVVSPGLYQENLDFLGKHIILRSSQPKDPEVVSSTIIEAERSGPTVLFASGESHQAALEGFTLRNNQGDFVIKIASATPSVSGNIIRDSKSGAIAIYYADTARIIANTIENNEAAEGGVIKCYYANPIIENNVIIDNVGSAISTYFSSPTILKNTISGNKDYHGTDAAIYMDHFSTATIQGNTISHTKSFVGYGGVGILLDFFSNSLIESNTISDNSGDGIFTIIDSSPVVINNIISENGEGLNISVSHPLLINNTVVDNGNGMYARDIANVTIANNIFSNDFDIGTEAFTQVNVTYSNIKGGWEGEGNISNAPMFIGGGDYHLKDGSPCIDTGTAVNAPDTDINGTMRPQGSGVDMGAYESECIKYVDSTGTCNRRDPCHERIQDAIDSVEEGCGATLKVANGHYREIIRLNSSKYIVLEALNPQYNNGSESIINGEFQLVDKTAVIRKGCFILSK